MRRTRYGGRITLKPRDFAGSAHMSPGFITNGHWIIKRERVQNESIYRTEDAARAALGATVTYPGTVTERDDAFMRRIWIQDDAVLEPYTVMPFTWTNGKTTWRILAGAPGPHGDGLALLDEKYLVLFTVSPGDVLYTPLTVSGPRGNPVMFDAKEPHLVTWGLATGRVKPEVLDTLAVLVHATTPARQKGSTNGD